MAVLASFIILDNHLKEWLREDIGRGDRTTESLLTQDEVEGKALWIAKADGVVAGLPIAGRVFRLLNEKVDFTVLVKEGEFCEGGKVIAQIEGSLATLLTGERVALNLAMRLSGIATLTRKYVEKIEDLPTLFVDTR